MNGSTSSVIPLSAAIKTTVDRIEQRYHNHRTRDSFSTGFRSLDDMIGGFHPGDLVAVLSDVPGLTTAFLLSSVHALVAWHRVPALFVSARHDENYLVTKLLSIESGIREIELRSAMLDAVHRSALTASASALNAAPLHIASIDAVTLEESIHTLTLAETDDDGGAAGPVFMDAPENRWSDNRVLPILRDTANDHQRPIVLSGRATPEQRDAWQSDRWFDVILQLSLAEVEAELVQVDVLQNRHGTIGAAYLQYDPHHSLVHDIEDAPMSWMNLFMSLRTINARYGETLRRLGEGAQ